MARLILVADDSPTIQKRAQGILQGEGFEVETVSNGVAAIKKLPKLQPILVLADVSMPGKDGYEVCDYVKTSADFHHVPVLLVASDLEPYDEPRGAQVGADGIIKKPFTPHDLIAMVAKFVALGEAGGIQIHFLGRACYFIPCGFGRSPPNGCRTGRCKKEATSRIWPRFRLVWPLQDHPLMVYGRRRLNLCSIFPCSLRLSPRCKSRHNLHPNHGLRLRQKTCLEVRPSQYLRYRPNCPQRSHLS